MGPAPRRPKKIGLPLSAPTAAELPATRGMLGEVRNELLERIDQSKDELRGEIHQVKDELRGEIHQVKTELSQIAIGLHAVQGGLHAVRADMARIAFLVEEQNARNKVVLDGLVAVISRQDRLEQRMDTVEETVRVIASARSSDEPLA